MIYICRKDVYFSVIVEFITTSEDLNELGSYMENGVTYNDHKEYQDAA